MLLSLLTCLVAPQLPLTNTELVDLIPTVSSLPDNFERAGARALFYAEAQGFGREPYATDGTPAGTVLLGDLRPGIAGSWAPQSDLFPGNTARGALIAPAGASAGTPLWITDGTPAGTTLLLDLYPGLAPKQIREGLEFDGQVFLAVVASGSNGGLWISDGTAAGTQLLREFVNISSLTRGTGLLADRVFFSARGGSEGAELWESDGSAAGTRLVADIDVGPGNGGPAHLTALGDRVFFTASTPATGRELFVTQGSGGATGLAAELWPGPNGPTWQRSIAFDGSLFFDCTGQAVQGRELWRFDPQTAAFAQVFDSTPGPGEPSQPTAFERSGDRLFFLSRSGPAGGFQPYRLFSLSSATAQPALASVGLALDLAPFLRLEPLGQSGRVAFPARAELPGAGLGTEWFVSDGTPAGTFQLADSFAGPGGGGALPFNPTGLRYSAVVADRLLFCASAGSAGFEPHSVPFGATGAWYAEPLGFGCGSFGAPAAQALSAPRAGQTLTLGLSDGAPLAPAFLEFSADAVQLPLAALVGQPTSGACTWFLANPLSLGSTQTDAAGAASLSFLLPSSPAWIGVDFNVQWLTLSLGGPVLGLAELSGGLALIVGP